MKEWATKHPWMTFFLADAAIAGVVNIVRAVIFAVSGKADVIVEETVANEQEGDE